MKYLNPMVSQAYLRYSTVSFSLLAFASYNSLNLPGLSTKQETFH